MFCAVMPPVINSTIAAITTAELPDMLRSA
jgi:hypothetical protein